MSRIYIHMLDTNKINFHYQDFQKGGLAHENSDWFNAICEPFVFSSN